MPAVAVVARKFGAQKEGQAVRAVAPVQRRTDLSRLLAKSSPLIGDPQLVRFEAAQLHSRPPAACVGYPCRRTETRGAIVVVVWCVSCVVVVVTKGLTSPSSGSDRHALHSCISWHRIFPAPSTASDSLSNCRNLCRRRRRWKRRCALKSTP